MEPDTEAPLFVYLFLFFVANTPLPLAKILCVHKTEISLPTKPLLGNNQMKQECKLQTKPPKQQRVLSVRCYYKKNLLFFVFHIAPRGWATYQRKEKGGAFKRGVCNKTMGFQTMTEKKKEEENEQARQRERREKEQQRMMEMAAKLAASQQAIATRRVKDTKRIIEEEKEGRRKFIDVDEIEAAAEDFRAQKRQKIEEPEREKNQKAMEEAIRKRQRWEDKKSRDCNEWKQGKCERGNGCKYKHTPKDHPRYAAFVEKHGGPPANILQFQDFEGVM
eukprot:TRINITY_DN7424_c0_g3_i2.p1 TRINITY_DN7424_c0_g3~~TRINITY_DN7424_c0_g3_i2.p1  ORF type:complete len:277 (+),score=56.28 TRINITY_DN7424_c0_g3_i2:524-1354(+)